jgi:hypothetical protein
VHGLPPPPGGHPALAVTTDAGATRGPPGVAIRVRLTGWSPCTAVSVHFGADRVAIVGVGRDGTASRSGISSPVDVPTGATTVRAACGSGARARRATATFLVTAATFHLPPFIFPVNDLRDLSFKWRDLLISAGAALLLIPLVAFPAEVFERTLDEHYTEVRRWFRLMPSAPRWSARIPPAVAYLAFVVVAAALEIYRDSSNLTAEKFVSHGLSVLVLTLGIAVPGLVLMWRKYHDRGTLRVLPFGLGLAAICVALSRVFNFHPGYLYGLVAGVAYARKLRQDEEGELAAIGVAAMLVMSLVALVALTAIRASAHTFWGSVGGETLTELFVMGLETAVITLVPMRFLEGKKIASWDRRLWAALFGLTAFAFIHAIFRPNNGFVDHGSENGLMAVVLFGAFSLFSFLFWLYFRMHDAPEGEEAVEGEGEVIVEGLD